MRNHQTPGRKRDTDTQKYKTIITLEPKADTLIKAAEEPKSVR